MSDETGTGVLVFANTPTLITPIIGAATGTSLSMSGNLTAAAGTFSSTLSAGASTLASASITGNETVGGTLAVTGAGTFSTTLSAGATTVASLVAPTITGGSSTTQSLTYKTTSGVGTTGADHIFQVGNNGATEAMRITNAANVGVGTNSPTAKFDVAAGTTTNVTGINLTGSVDDFFQYNVQNTSTGTKAQSGYAATANNGTNTTGFAWMGINSSLFSNPQTYNIGLANDVTYIGSGQDMHIANANNKTSIVFSTGKAATPYFDEKMRLTNSGTLAIGTIGASTVDTVNAKLHIAGKVKIVDGNQAAGKVLTSDANGLATWTYGAGTTSTQTSAYTITLSDKYVFYGSTATAVATFTLPLAASNAGKEIIIKNKSAYTLTVQRAGSTETIFQDNVNNAATSITLGIEASNNWVKLVSDGTQWVVFRALF